MSYDYVKVPHVYCPDCSKKMNLLVGDTEEASFYICFRCRKVGQFGIGNLPERTSLRQLSTEDKQLKIRQLISQLPEKYTYKAVGSQLRLQTEGHYSRQWLSLAEYTRIFGEAIGYAKIDLREAESTCKWCGKGLPAGRRSFCKDSCSRNYSKLTFVKRTLATLPYRIACRDRFYCQATGKNLAQINRHNVRIPAAAGELTVHHLVPVAQGGSDHESNLITLDRQVHQDYHAGNQTVVQKIEAIKAQRWQQFSKKMVAQESGSHKS